MSLILLINCRRRRRLTDQLVAPLMMTADPVFMSPDPRLIFGGLLRIICSLRMKTQSAELRSVSPAHTDLTFHFSSSLIWADVGLVNIHVNWLCWYETIYWCSNESLFPHCWWLLIENLTEFRLCQSINSLQYNIVTVLVSTDSVLFNLLIFFSLAQVWPSCNTLQSEAHHVTSTGLGCHGDRGSVIRTSHKLCSNSCWMLAGKTLAL